MSEEQKDIVIRTMSSKEGEVKEISLKVHRMNASIPSTQNLFLAVGFILINLYQFFLLPLFLLPKSMWWGITLIPLSALTFSFYALIHEAIHIRFHPSQRINLAAGRLLAIFFGSPFAILRVGHLLHHKYNRTLGRPEVYDPAEISKSQFAVGYYFMLLGGLYIEEVLLLLPFFLPRRLLSTFTKRLFKRNTLPDKMFKGLIETIWEVRLDGIAIVTLFVSSTLCYGKNWYLLAMILVARAFFIAFLDNIYHYRTPIDDVLYGTNLWLSRPFSKILLNFNLHGVHHKYPYLPWNKLPEAFTSECNSYDANYFMAAIRQLSGPVSIAELENMDKGVHLV